MIRKYDDSMGGVEGQRDRRRRRLRYSAPALLCLLLLLGACRGATVVPTVVPVAVAASPQAPLPDASPAPAESTTVATATATVAATASPTPLLPNLPLTAPPEPSPPPETVPLPAASPSLSPTLSLTATATPPPSPTPPFRQVDLAEAGQIHTLWVAPSGAVWAVGSGGVVAAGGGAPVLLTSRPGLAVLGADRAGRIWALFEEGRTVGVYQGGTWRYYGAEAGWEAAPDAVFARARRVVLDDAGGVWLALGREGARRLDPASDRWSELPAAQLGFAPAPAGQAGLFGHDPRLAFTAVARDHFGNIWLAACAVRVAEGDARPLLLGDGQGARWFDGEAWAGPADSGERCIQDIELDGQGNVWLAGRENDLWHGNALLRYEPDPGHWLQLPLPESDPLFAETPRFAADIWFDGSGRPWLRVERRGGASLPPQAVYYLEAGEWVPFLTHLFGRLAGYPPSTSWLLLENDSAQLAAGLYRHDGAGFRPVPLPTGLFQPESLAVDGQGRAWFIGLDGRSLWYYAGP